MKFNERWLREWVDPPCDGPALAEHLTMAGLELESRHAIALSDPDAVLARVEALTPHPESPDLQCCRLRYGRQTDETTLAICDSGSLQPGKLVACVRPRDGQSARLCRGREFGLLEEDTETILYFDDSADLGTSCASLFPADHRLDVALTPNRGDCLSVLGIARELAALTRAPLKRSAVPPCAVTGETVRKVHIADPSACPRYLAQIIEGVDVQRPTPFWMQWRLRLAGVRPVNAVVDVTNYVMLELGQPLHAFDLDRLTGTLTVRGAEADESLVLLHGGRQSLQSDTLLIADERGPVAIAGIMGGRSSAVHVGSSTVFLECAWFSPPRIAGRARAYGLQTESSYRFERGVDPCVQTLALSRATALIIELCGGRAAPVQVQEHVDFLPTPETIHLRRSRIACLLGVSMETETVEGMLRCLGMTVQRNPASTEVEWSVIPPSYRFDIHIEADLIEELARLQTYDRIPASRPRMRVRVQRRPALQQRLARTRQALVARGYQESLSYSFVDPMIQQRFLEPDTSSLSLTNPIAAEYSVMRESLWPGLIQAARYNIRRQETRIRLFESGRVFTKQGDTVNECFALGGIIVGKVIENKWYSGDTPSDFYDMKADVECLLQALGFPETDCRPTHHPGFRPGHVAALLQGDCHPSGIMGALHPALCADWALPDCCYLFQLYLDGLPVSPRPAYRPPARTPLVRRDLALLVAQDLPAGELLAYVRQELGSELVALALFDVYQGSGVPEGKKSLALSLTFQRESSTLRDCEVESLLGRLLTRLKEAYDARLRE